MVRKLMLAGVLAASLVASACNTVEGVGEDLSSAGDAVADAAR